MKYCLVLKDITGYWKIVDWDTNKQIGGFYDNELAAYKAANFMGYIVK